MHLENLAQLGEEEFLALEGIVTRHATLVDALEYSVSCGNPAAFPAVVVQDEYTHDVVFPGEDGYALVYGTT